MYTIIDIETTGGSPKTEKITEIAIYVHDGKEIIDEFQSLVNPERNIPVYITNLTGITNEMVADAPKFYEIARKIVEITENRIFVAHNASFDYGFVKQEFKNLGFEFNRKTICTVKLSKRLIPGHKSYSLGNLCDDFGIHINGRHRAAGDALATIKLFEILLATQENNSLPLLSSDLLDLSNLHPEFNRNRFKEIPPETGVYYFYNADKELIYIGKSVNIHSRVLSHFSNTSTKKAIQMKSEIADIDFEKTGSELIALLKESHEIKENKPIYNRAQRRSRYQYGIYSYTNSQGYTELKVEKNSGNKNTPINTYSSPTEAKEVLNKLIEEFELCQKLCNLYQSKNSCFHYEIGHCKGACIGEEYSESYNERAAWAMGKLAYIYPNFFIIDKGRSRLEHAVVKVENGKYIGYGFLAADQISNQELLHDCIQIQNDNRETHMIISRFLRENKQVSTLQF